MSLTSVILLLHLLALHIGDLDITLDIYREVKEVLAIILLHIRLVEDVLFHVMTEGAFIHLEKDQDPVLALLLGVGQFFLEVAPGFIEEMFIGIARTGRPAGGGAE